MMLSVLPPYTLEISVETTKAFWLKIRMKLTLTLTSHVVIFYSVKRIDSRTPGAAVAE